MSEHPEAQSAPTREELRERIARSIYHTQGGQTARFPWPPSNKKRWFQRADAVLAALAPSPEDVALIAAARAWERQCREHGATTMRVEALIPSLRAALERASGLTPEEGA